jgi:adenine-specific DNA glycosylase
LAERRSGPRPAALFAPWPRLTGVQEQLLAWYAANTRDLPWRLLISI